MNAAGFLSVMWWVLIVVIVFAIAFLVAAAVAGIMRAARMPSRAQAWDEGFDAAVAARGLPDVYQRVNPYKKEETDG